MPRRTLRNTTALALGLSIALPHLSIAQSAAPIGGQAPLVLAQAEDAGTAPVVVPPAAATAEGAAGAGDQSGGEAEAPEPAAEKAPAQPEAAAVEEPAAADAPSEPKAEAAPPAEAASQPVVVPEAATDTDPKADAEARSEAAAAARAKSAPEPEAAPEPEVAPVTQAAPEPEAAPEPAVASEGAGQPAPVETPTAVQAPTAPEPAPTAEELAGEDTTSATEPAARPAVAQEPAASDTPAPAKPDTADAAPERAPEIAAPSDMPSEADIARALAGEDKPSADTATAPAPAAAETTGSAPVVGGAAAPDAPAADTAAPPSPVQDNVANTTDSAPRDAELDQSLADARAVPEAEAPPTDAAREAAAADTAPAAAALAESAAPVATSDTRKVTDETARSATEDFLTDLQGTLRQGDIPVVGGKAQQDTSAPVVVGADSQPVTDKATQGADKGDDRSNLEKALRQAVLPALAGLAVGQLLSNNRQVELNTGDRVVVTRPDGSQEIIKDDNALLLRPGSTVQTEEYADGSTRTVVTREDGSQVVTIRDADLRVLRRTLVQPDGTTTALIDETAAVAPVDVASLPPPARPITVAPGQQLSEDALREALRRETQVNRTFTLGQIRNIPEVRALVAPVDIQAITFDTGSAAIKPDQAQALSTLGRVIADSVRRNPAEIYMIEGHTDTVGADAMNLALSDRRAESVALALTEFFGVPPENMVVQGYGEQFLRVPQEGDIRANRRAAVRRITDLLARN